MQLLKIDSIRYGWFEVSLMGHYMICSNYLDYDTPKKLLRAVLNLLKKKSEEEWICWQDEPGAEIMKLTISEDELEIDVYDSEKTSYELGSADTLLKKNRGEHIWSKSIGIPIIVDNLVTEFSLYENGNGLSMYEKNWMEFPQKEYDELKAYAYKLSKQRSKNNEYDELFCTTY